MAVNYEYYKVFYYAAKYQSFSRAAHMLHLTQPTVSHYIQTLEQELGVTLFTRSKHGVSMTREAAVMYQNISEAIDHIARAETDLHNYVSMNSGDIHLSATETGFTCAVLPVIQEYNRLYPHISIKVASDYTTRAVRRLESGLVDCAVVTEPLGKIGSSVMATPLLSFRDVLVCSEKYRFLANRPHILQELTDFPFILNQIPAAEDFYIEKLEPFFINRSPSTVMNLTVEHYSNQKKLLLMDLGLGVIPNILIRKELEEGQLFEIPLEEPIPPRKIYLLYRKDIHLSVAARRFMEMLQEKYTQEKQSSH